MQRTATTLLILATGLLLSGCITIQPPMVAQDDDRTETAQPTAPGSSLDTDCGDGDSILLNEPGVDYRLTGDCAEVVVEGTDIDVDAEGIGSLILRGDDNDIDARAVGSIEVSGQDNDVSVDSVGSVVLTGNGNDVDSNGDVGSVAFNGNDNSVDADGQVGPVTDNGSDNEVD